MSALNITALERIATEATAAGIDPVLALAEKVDIVAHDTDWITLDGGIHLSLGRTGWHATLVSAPGLRVGSALTGGAW